jgi:hypothetical protein
MRARLWVIRNAGVSSDNDRLSAPWREVIVLLTVMESIFEPSSAALVYGPKSAFR